MKKKIAKELRDKKALPVLSSRNSQKRKKKQEEKIVNYEKHPWDTWFRNKVTILKRHKDFQCQSHSLSVQIRAEAIRRKIKVAVTLRDDVLTIRRK